MNEVEQAILALTREVAGELHPQRKLAGGLGLDSTLDKDFGLDSLGRLELAGRIEEHFAKALDEARIAAAETPRDLAGALESAAASAKPKIAQKAKPQPETEAESGPHFLPDLAGTLTEALDWHVDLNPGKVFIRLYEEEGEGETITYAALREEALTIAAGLSALGVGAGDAVALMLPTGRNYFISFFGVLYAGAIAVPIYPPARITQIGDHIQRHKGILANCRAKVMIAMEEATQVAALLKSSVDTMDHLVTVDELLAARAHPPRPVADPGAIAFLQYTSGSTGAPKGVVLTHANLLANVRAMGQAMEVDENDVFVSWLPLYHDMGLIGAFLGTLYHGVPLVIMAPLAFLARPIRWLDAITRYKGTITAAPNFAYELCVKRIADDKLEGLDLSTLRAAANGAEPVVAATLERFCERFAKCGFRRQAMMPVYGLAECSVGLAFPPLNRGPKVERIKRDLFSGSGVAELAHEDDPAALTFPASGRALPGHEIRIVDAAGHPLPERNEGRLQFRGPSATSGYFRNPTKTAELVQDNGWLDSGDMAYMDAGEVFITGRSKDIIIRAGRNVYPAELEDAVGEVDGVRKGAVAVFASPDPQTGSERLVVLAETRKTDADAVAVIRAGIEALAVDITGVPADEVVLAPPGTVLKTSSGKIRRAASREVFEKGLVGKTQPPPWLQIAKLTLAAAWPQAKRAWRGLWSWGYGAYAWTLVALAFGPAWLLAVLPPTLEQRWALMGGLLRVLLWLAGIRIQINGREHLPRCGADGVIVSNHQSYLDVFALVAALPGPVRFVAKGELKKNFVIRSALERLGCAFVERFDAERGMADARDLAATAKDGAPLFYFAEGSFNDTPGVLPFRLGAFAAAEEAGLGCAPIAIRGARACLPGGTWFPRPGLIRLSIGKTIQADGESTWGRTLSLRDQSRAWIVEHSGEPDLGAERAAIFDRPREE